MYPLGGNIYNPTYRVIDSGAVIIVSTYNIPVVFFRQKKIIEENTQLGYYNSTELLFPHHYNIYFFISLFS